MVNEKQEPQIEIDDSPEVDFAKQTQVANELDLQLGIFEALRIYPVATFWAAFFAFSLVMVGYDSGVVFSLFGISKFAEKYGEEFEGTWIISAPWQSALSMGTSVGQVTGSLACGWVSEKIGRKRTFALCNVWTLGFIFMQFFSTNIKILTAAEFMAGQAYGFYLVLAPSYAAEVLPTSLRGILQASLNLSYVIGQWIGSGVALGLQGKDSEWSYKGQFAVQWLWCPMFLVLIWFPWWLVRQGRLEEAERSLRRLSRPSPKVDIKAVMAMIQQTNIYEREIENASTYMDCFKGVNWRRTEITIGVQVWQVITGINLIGYAVVFFEAGGFPQERAFVLGLVNTAIGFTATCCSWPLMSYVGRRNIYMYGLVIMTVCLLVIGILDCIPNYTTRTGLSVAQAVFLDLLTFAYQITIGPICFVIFGEAPSTRLKSRTIAISAAIGSTISIALAVGVPYMLNAAQANWRGKSGFFFAGFAIMGSVWCYYRLPETKGRTFDELDLMFDQKVPTREFGKYQVSYIHGEA